ncbi:MAG TPA: hypothetical protein VGX25_28475, partial [Actinophytocola sp.]|nr:hypothetical protein [Actinophytocola sp.]
MDGAATMAPRLGFKHHLRVEVAPGKGAYLFDERGVTMLKGPHIDALAGLLDGTRDLENLFEAAPDGITPEQVAAIVLRLSEAGLLAVRPPELAGAAPAVLAYWEAGGLDAAAAITAVTAGSVRVSGVGAVDPAATLAALRAAGADAHRADPLDPPR